MSSDKEKYGGPIVPPEAQAMITWSDRPDHLYELYNAFEKKPELELKVKLWVFWGDAGIVGQTFDAILQCARFHSWEWEVAGTALSGIGHFLNSAGVKTVFNFGGHLTRYRNQRNWDGCLSLRFIDNVEKRSGGLSPT